MARVRKEMEVSELRLRERIGYALCTFNACMFGFSMIVVVVCVDLEKERSIRSSSSSSSSSSQQQQPAAAASIHRGLSCASRFLMMRSSVQQ